MLELGGNPGGPNPAYVIRTNREGDRGAVGNALNYDVLEIGHLMLRLVSVHLFCCHDHSRSKPVRARALQIQRPHHQAPKLFVCNWRNLPRLAITKSGRGVSNLRTVGTLPTSTGLSPKAGVSLSKSTVFLRALEP